MNCERTESGKYFFGIVFTAQAHGRGDCSLVIVTYLWSANPEVSIPERQI